MHQVVKLLAAFLEGVALERLRPVQLALVLEQGDAADRIADLHVDMLGDVFIERDAGTFGAVAQLRNEMTEQGVEGAAGPNVAGRRADAGSRELALQGSLTD